MQLKCDASETCWWGCPNLGVHLLTATLPGLSTFLHMCLWKCQLLMWGSQDSEAKGKVEDTRQGHRNQETACYRNECNTVTRVGCSVTTDMLAACSLLLRLFTVDCWLSRCLSVGLQSLWLGSNSSGAWWSHEPQHWLSGLTIGCHGRWLELDTDGKRWAMTEKARNESPHLDY